MTESSPVFSAGNWPSWVSPALVSGRVTGLSELRTAGHWIFWLESRAEEKGRGVVVGRSPDGTIHDLTPGDADVGTRVHEYGGGAWDVRLTAEGSPEVVFSDRKTGAVWHATQGRAVCWAEGGSAQDVRYADFSFDPAGPGAFCVVETHGCGAPEASLAYLTADQAPVTLREGADFYAAPRPSPDGRFLAWFSWQNPEMPWTRTTLAVSELSRTPLRLGQSVDLCTEGSTIEPRWADTTTLYATSDRSGLWTPIRCSVENAVWTVEDLPSADAETGLPHWVFGQRTLAPLPDGRLLALGIAQGLGAVAEYDGTRWNRIPMGAPVNVPEPLADGGFAWIDAPPDASPAIAIGHGDQIVRFRESVTLPATLTPADIAVPEPLTFPTTHGAVAHALFYAPASSSFSLRAGEKPPLVVMAHGGPTGRASPAFAFKIQWWTSRGFAVLDVNYRGSTGFGRQYREALDGEWGVVDVEDCLAGVRYVIEKGLVDPERCVIRGSSAGGLTVLSALARSDIFAAGTSLYGVTDLRALVAETHKFEAQYLDRLIGPYPASEARYIARSPITHAREITAPVLFLHGGADKVVPLGQAQEMQARLKGSELHIYPDEGHGFRSSDVIEDALMRELAFYQAVLF